MIKAVFFDVDGTLVSFKTHSVPTSTRIGLQKLREQGIKVFLATGRSEKSFQKVNEIIGFEFDGYIYSNGQYVKVNDQVIHDVCLNKNDLENVLAYVEENHISVHFSELEYSYINFMNDRMEELRRLLGVTLPPASIDDPKRSLENPTYQLSVYINEAEEEDFFKQTTNMAGVRWHELFVDVIPKDGGKTRGIDKMLEHFDIKLEDSMAFGDGGNDSAMLGHVGHGIAMGNAVESAKAASKFVTDDVDNDGIYKALERYGLVN